MRPLLYTLGARVVQLVRKRAANYELSGEYTALAALDVAGHPVSVDLPALTRR
jgi:hypothetical protein